MEDKRKRSRGGKISLRSKINVQIEGWESWGDRTVIRL